MEVSGYTVKLNTFKGSKSKLNQISLDRSRSLKEQKDYQAEAQRETLKQQKQTSQLKTEISLKAGFRHALLEDIRQL